MILEIAQIDVTPGQEAAFETAVAQARPLFDGATGCHGISLHRSVEMPSRYRLFVKWDSVEAHNVAFRGSPAFAQWRGLVGGFFATAPVVEHVGQVL
jgi:heme-degrading monooxygenase HmoA